MGLFNGWRDEFCELWKEAYSMDKLADKVHTRNLHSCNWWVFCWQSPGNRRWTWGQKVRAIASLNHIASCHYGVMRRRAIWEDVNLAIVRRTRWWGRKCSKSQCWLSTSMPWAWWLKCLIEKYTRRIAFCWEASRSTCGWPHRWNKLWGTSGQRHHSTIPSAWYQPPHWALWGGSVAVE